MKTTEFLYTKPAPRTRIITAKLGAGVLQLAVVWAAVYLGSIWSIKSVTSMGSFGHDLAVFMAATALTQFVFFALGMLFAAVARSANAPAKWMSGAVFATYILSVIAQFSGYGALRHISVFSYFNAPDIVKNGGLNAIYVAICLVAGLGAIGAAYVIYRRRDLTV
jgi:ABC-2 type transport system permease protein